MSTISVSSSATGGTGSTGGGGDSTSASITGSQISIITDPYSNPRVHFADSVDDDDYSVDGLRGYSHKVSQSPRQYDQASSSSSQTMYQRSSTTTSTLTPNDEYEPQETVCYSAMYLCPQEGFKSSMTRSQPNSPAGSNVSIVGSLASPCRKSTGPGSSSSNWKLRTRYSKRRGQERSSDRERQPSVCSDSETDSISGKLVIEDLCLATPTTKKWSLPLPIVTRSSESDSASSSWSARSADEATEDERSPVPSPSASTHSGDVDYGIMGRAGSQNQLYTPEHSPKALKAAEQQSKKLAEKAKTEHKTVQELAMAGMVGMAMAPIGGTGDEMNFVKEGSSKSSSTSKDKSKGRKKKRQSRAAESHRFKSMKATNYGRCKICDAYVYFWGLECTQCQLICHRKCVKKMAIMCPQAPLPPRCGILNVDLESLSADEKVPVLVLKCTQEIERRSITRPGIYRMTGVASRVEKLLKSFESGPHLIDLTDVSANDLTSVLKIFLRELKEPLVSNDIYKSFIDIGRIYRVEDVLATDGIVTGNAPSEMIKQLRLAVCKLSTHRFATLRHMMSHLNRVTGCHDQNNMTAAALGIIFAPTIFRPRDTINDLYTEVFEAGPQARVIELLIRYYENVFEDPAELYFGPTGTAPTEDQAAEAGGPSGPQSGALPLSAGGCVNLSSTEFPFPPPCSPNEFGCSDSSQFSNSNPTATIGASLYNRPTSSRVAAAARHNQVRRTSSSSSASPSPAAGVTCNAHHHHHHHHHKKTMNNGNNSSTNPLSSASQDAPTSPHPHHCPLSSSASTFTFD